MASKKVSGFSVFRATVTDGKTSWKEVKKGSSKATADEFARKENASEEKKALKEDKGLNDLTPKGTELISYVVLPSGSRPR
jgi:hypothetical protein